MNITPERALLGSISLNTDLQGVIHETLFQATSGRPCRPHHRSKDLGCSYSNGSLTTSFVAPSTTPIFDNGIPAQPTANAKTGAWVKNGDTQLSWNRTKGTLAFKVSVVYIGPIKGTAVFKIGSKTHTCVVNFGTLKKQTTAKRLILTSPNVCSGAKEKAQLAALKKAPVNMVVKLTIARDMKYPTTYAKYRTETRVIYAKLG